MVTKYGMSDKVGNVSIDYDDDGRSLSSETRSAVEEEVRQPCSFSSFMQCVHEQSAADETPKSMHVPGIRSSKLTGTSAVVCLVLVHLPIQLQRLHVT